MYNNIVIGFSRAKNPMAIGSQLIRFYENTSFSHTYITFFSDLYQRQMVIQASHGYVHELSYDMFLEQNIIVEEFKIGCSSTELMNIFSFIAITLGKNYSYFQLFMILVRPWLGKFFKSVNDDESYICSELAAKITTIAHLNIHGELDYITPRILNEYLHEQLNSNMNVQQIR